MLGRLPKIVLSLVLILLVILLLWNRNARGSPNILLVTIDTLRADHLGCYGYSRATSPNLDALAAAGVSASRQGVRGVSRLRDLRVSAKNSICQTDAPHCSWMAVSQSREQVLSVDPSMGST
jgi:hypothetical protein